MPKSLTESFVRHITSQPGPRGDADRRAYWDHWIAEQLDSPEQETALHAGRLRAAIRNMEGGMCGRGDMDVLAALLDFLESFNRGDDPAKDNPRAANTEARRHRSEHQLVMEKIIKPRR
jgi:hypothetical protein